MSGTVTFDFSGQAVFVTGGSNGIGLAIARAFHAAGAQVTITGTRAAATDYEHTLDDFAYQRLRMEDCARVAAVIGRLERLNVLVNCAGTTLRGQEFEPDAFEAVVRVNLLGSQCAASAAFPLLERVGGTVLNIASMSSYFGFPRVPAYGASKTAIVSLTKSLACAWAAAGVRVNAIAPGFIVTNFTQPVRNDEQLSATILARTPAGRFGQPDEMGPMALFLCSDAAKFVTGVTVPIDGGFAANGL